MTESNRNRIERIPGDYYIAVNDNAMGERIPQGSRAYIATGAAASGDIVAATIDGKAPIIRKLEVDGDTLTLTPACTGYTALSFNGKERERVQIIGKVTAVFVAMVTEAGNG